MIWKIDRYGKTWIWKIWKINKVQATLLNPDGCGRMMLRLILTYFGLLSYNTSNPMKKDADIRMHTYRQIDRQRVT